MPALSEVPARAHHEEGDTESEESGGEPTRPCPVRGVRDFETFHRLRSPPWRRRFRRLRENLQCFGNGRTQAQSTRGELPFQLTVQGPPKLLLQKSSERTP